MGNEVSPTKPDIAQRGVSRPGVERRRNPRIALPRGFLALIGLPDEQPVAVSGRDISKTGIGFFHASDLAPGTGCTMTLRALNGDLIPIRAKVVRRRAVRDRVFEVGVEFESEIEPSRFVATDTPVRTPARNPADIAEARAHIGALAAAMKRMAEDEAPLDELFDKIHELTRLCDSARPADEG